MFDYWWILVIINVFLIIYNIFYNKKIVFTLLLVGIDSFFSSTRILHVGSLFVQSNLFYFSVVSIIVLLAMVFIKLKNKLNKRWISFTFVFIIAIMFIYFLYIENSMAPYVGISIYEMPGYDKERALYILSFLQLSLIQINLFINYISQKKND